MRKKIGLWILAFLLWISNGICHPLKMRSIFTFKVALALVCEWSIFFQIRIYFFGSDRRRHSSRRKTRLSRHSTQKAPILVVQYTQNIWKSRKKGHRKFNDDLWQKRSSVVTWILKCLQYLVQSYLCMWYSPWEMMLVCRYWMTSLHIYGH